MASNPEGVAAVVVRLLREVASGAVSSEDAMSVLLAREAEIVGQKCLVGAWALIDHFGIDSDTRSKEPDFDLRQRREMEELAAEIERKGGGR